MATLALPNSAGRSIPASRPRDDNTTRRKKEKRSDIWSNLLRQTREAQARSRTQTLQHRELIVCGGSPSDQRTFVRNLARPPPPAPLSRNRDRDRDQRPQRPKGEVKLSNSHAYGYGHVTLYCPPQQTAGMLLGGEAEEAVRMEVHTLPEPDGVYEGTLRRLLAIKSEGRGDGVEDDVGDEVGRGEWLQLLARSLLPPETADEDPMEVVKEHKLALTIVVQHVEAQESLERDGYREESFDYISQCLRTAVLPLSAALVYTSSSTPPQQPASTLSDVQKVIFTGMALDLAPLSPAPSKTTTTANRDDLAPKHNVVDRMAIVVPSGWDSLGKIRLLSETFSPEAVLDAWTTDLRIPVLIQPNPTQPDDPPEQASQPEYQANGGAERHEPEAEVYATSEVGDEDSELASRPTSPSKQSLSTIATFEQTILNPNAYKVAKPPQIQVTTKPTQQFLAEMRTHLLELEAQDTERAKNNPGSSSGVSTTAGAIHSSSTSTTRVAGLPSGGEQSGALENLGDVSFNVGGVNYNAVSASAAIERLKRPAQPSGLESPVIAASPSSGRNITPRQPRREDRAADVTPRSLQRSSARSTSGRDGSSTQPMDKLEVDKLEEYFASLMKKGTPSGGGTGSGSSTPSKAQR
ncbi:hypothetical protein LTR78_003017 [Recurvomyces mirabilis]|uniref:Uncharacterized protein n=1 Tax=Recurvomyces mirabilis TaxID=574656 RepID=A0AAE0WS28_9PEZI|nr:hypothetical protein LTR78_003017 [Recurvomyces mirabilis]